MPVKYILVTQLETTGAISCKLQGLSEKDISNLEKCLATMEIIYIKQQNFIEVETQGVRVLNLLAGTDYNFRVVGQSMVIEKSNIGSRTIQYLQTTWTLMRNE